jgi:hypothetical protein
MHGLPTLIREPVKGKFHWLSADVAEHPNLAVVHVSPRQPGEFYTTAGNAKRGFSLSRIAVRPTCLELPAIVVGALTVMKIILVLYMRSFTAAYASKKGKTAAIQEDVMQLVEPSNKENDDASDERDRSLDL